MFWCCYVWVHCKRPVKIHTVFLELPDGHRRVCGVQAVDLAAAAERALAWFPDAVVVTADLVLADDSE